MPKIIEPIEPYSHEWFVIRAFQSLKEYKPGLWDFSDSLLMYTPQGERQYETIQSEKDRYAALITLPEMDYLCSIADDVVRALPERFEYIDLGPGTAHKEQFLFDAAKKQGKTFLYRPVDISMHYLQLSSRYAEEQGIEVSALRASFEELPVLLGPPALPRFVSLGLTFSNYHPQEILTLLRAIAGPSGCFFVGAQMRDRIDMQTYIQVYEQDVCPIADAKVHLLGLDPKTDCTKVWVSDEMGIYYTLGRVNPELEARGVKVGDTLLVFQSLRSTKEAFEYELARASTSYTLFDVQSSFIAALARV